MPVTVWFASVARFRSAGDVHGQGAMLSNVSTTAALVPVLPKLSVTVATIEFVPWFGSVTLAEKLPSACTVAVPSVAPLSVKVTVWPATVAAPPIRSHRTRDRLRQLCCLLPPGW